MRGQALTSSVLRVATRGSLLARTQTEQAVELLRSAAPDARFELVIVRTSGDRGRRDTVGAFVREIQQALLSGEADLAVHSLKDLPVEPTLGLALAAIPPRADARDVLVTRGPALADLPPGALVGTGSPRRAAQLRRLRRDVQTAPMAGNVDTRLRRLASGDVDALLLAAAALERLGYAEALALGEAQVEGSALAVSALPLEAMLPAPGQGALAIECRADRDDLLDLARRVDHAPTRRAVEAERALLKLLGGGCRAPMGAFGTVSDGCCRLAGFHAEPDGPRSARSEVEGPAERSEALAEDLAERLCEALRRPLAGLRVLVTRPREQAAGVVGRLAALGSEPILAPAIEIAPPPEWGELDALLRGLAERDWVVFTSANGVRCAAERAREIGATLPGEAPPKLAAIGPATARALAEAWRPPDAVPERYLSEEVAEALGDAAGQRVALARADIARRELPEELRRRGACVEEIVAYSVRSAPDGEALRGLVGPPDIIAFGSPSAVRGLHALLQDLRRESWLRGSDLACIGPVTEHAVRELGLTPRWVASSYTWDGLVDAIVGEGEEDER